MEVFIGTILPFGFSYAPSQWQLCQGQIVPLSQNQALFALLGTIYGGNGTTNFGLPDLRGRTPIGQGQGLGLSNYTIGQNGGTENTTVTINNMPAHTHTAALTVGVQLAGVTSTSSPPVNAPTTTNNVLGASTAGQGSAAIWSTSTNGTPVPLGGVSGSVTVGSTGNTQPLSVLNPFLALNFSIALFGIYPTRN